MINAFLSFSQYLHNKWCVDAKKAILISTLQSAM